MKIHEYQGKQLLAKYGVTVPRGEVVDSAEQVRAIVERLGLPVVVKAQIHAGGRGKGGGVKLARTIEDAEEIARQMIGMKLVTPQTGPEGREVRRVLIEEGLKIKQEFYLGIVLDRAISQLVFMASAAGGMDIEEVAAHEPDKILKEPIDPAVGLLPFQARKLAFGIGLPKELANKAVKFMTSLYRAYVDLDASLAEINPFLLTEDGELYALDAKLNFDDNALFRHKEYSELRDLNEEDPLEIEASKYDLNYIKLDGNIGCMVNGAGLAMATMDIIKLAGGEPANFLDVGGGASQQRVENAFRILLSDPNVRAVLINIFGGIVRTDMVAMGVVEAARKIGVKIPVVVRLEGTNVERGREVIEQSGLGFVTASGMKDAAEKVVALAHWSKRFGEITKGEITKGEITKGEITKGEITKGEITKAMPGNSDEIIRHFAFQLDGAAEYNKDMARGWESKSVEAQIEDNRFDEHKAHRSRAEVELRRKKESLLLSRTRIVEELKTSRNPRYKKILTDALADLDEKLAEFR